MRNLIFFIFLFVALASRAEAWTLDQCIDYALAHNAEVRQRILAQKQGDLDVTDAKDRFLPQVSGYGSQNFNFGRGLTANNTYANRNTQSFAVGAQLSLPLFQGLRAVRGLEYSRKAMKALIEHTEETRANVTLNVITGYLQALYAREVLEVAKMSLNISTDELARRRQLLDAGKIAELDICEAQAQVAADELSVVNARNDSTLAMLDLSQLLNIPRRSDFDIVPVGQDIPVIPSLDSALREASLRNHGIRAAALDVEAAEANVAVAKAAYIPTLSFSAGLGSNYYKTTGYTNESFSSQMRHNFAKSLGFSLNVPVFDGLSTRNSVRRARLQQESYALALDNTRTALEKAIVQAHTQAAAALKKTQASEASLLASEQAFRAMQVKYDCGRANATEYEKAKSDYTSAMAQLVQARYEAVLRARILDFYCR